MSSLLLNIRRIRTEVLYGNNTPTYSQIIKENLEALKNVYICVTTVEKKQ